MIKNKNKQYFACINIIIRNLSNILNKSRNVDIFYAKKKKNIDMITSEKLVLLKILGTIAILVFLYSISD